MNEAFTQHITPIQTLSLHQMHSTTGLVIDNTGTKVPTPTHSPNTIKHLTIYTTSSDSLSSYSLAS